LNTLYCTSRVKLVVKQMIKTAAVVDFEESCFKTAPCHYIAKVVAVGGYDNRGDLLESHTNVATSCASLPVVL
jgi:hypothetical protein